MAAEEWEKLKQKHEQEIKMEKEAREAQLKAEQEYQQLIAEEQAAYEAKRMGIAAAPGAAALPPVSFQAMLFPGSFKIDLCRRPRNCTCDC